MKPLNLPFCNFWEKERTQNRNQQIKDNFDDAQNQLKVKIIFSFQIGRIWKHISSKSSSTERLAGQLRKYEVWTFPKCFTIVNNTWFPHLDLASFKQIPKGARGRGGGAGRGDVVIKCNKTQKEFGQNSKDPRAPSLDFQLPCIYVCFRSSNIKM